MEFRNPTETERSQVEGLWAYCFEPKGHPFYEWYFANCYEPENILVGVEAGQVLTNVHLRQYTLSVRNKALPVSYIVGVATHPAARRGGVGGELLLASLAELKKRGQALTILMPSKAAFYQQYGWELYCHQWMQTLRLEDLRSMTERSLSFGLLNSVDQWRLLAPVYEAYTANLSGYAIRSEADWRRLLGSVFNEGVYIAIVKQDDMIEGYMMYSLGAPEIVVSEFVYTSRRAQKALLNYIYNHRSQGETMRWNEGSHDEGYIFQPNGKEGHSTMPFMMSRIVDVQTALEVVPVTEDAINLALVKSQAFVFDADLDALSRTLRFAVSDPLATWNTGFYDVTFSTDNGVTAKRVGDLEVSTVSATMASTMEGVDVSITVGGLGLLLMGRLTASELAYESKLIADGATLDFLDSVYPKQKTYINEWW